MSPRPTLGTVMVLLQRTEHRTRIDSEIADELPCGLLANEEANLTNSAVCGMFGIAQPKRLPYLVTEGKAWNAGSRAPVPTSLGTIGGMKDTKTSARWR